MALQTFTTNGTTKSFDYTENMVVSAAYDLKIVHIPTSTGSPSLVPSTAWTFTDNSSSTGYNYNFAFQTAPAAGTLAMGYETNSQDMADLSILMAQKAASSPMAGAGTAGQVMRSNGPGKAPAFGLLQGYGTTTNALGTITKAASSINLADGNSVTATIDTTDTTFTFSGAVAGDDMSEFVLTLVNGGKKTVTWPASVMWSGGKVPTLTKSGTDVLTFITQDGGTTWMGTLVTGAVSVPLSNP